jgi:hypothetical protein
MRVVGLVPGTRVFIPFRILARDPEMISDPSFAFPRRTN